ncbi:aspartate aminotransferase protein [Diplodia corticola]|uniref:Aspartate aminotransferase protein n=1 Tax=Diplodia corticola TaxID=236234 RepID=A0A1J9RAD7_9PEZI|nr:aspartate aminotransferase protein [Diplodia corticola]OJD37433.1 aspartate aminotransferase protein [Diplodia corticola]
MFETLQAVSALAQTIQLAYRLWEAGFSKAKNAHKQYIEFGVTIQNLGKNLDRIKSVTENACSQLQRRRLRAFDDDELLDTKSLDQIVGNYAKTLADCERLLRDKSKFRHDSRNFVLNIVWNLEIEPEVTKLRDRLAFHNVKILMLLKPLEMKMLADIQTLILDLHDEVMFELKEIKGILTGPATDQAAEERGLLTRSLSVPEALASRLHSALIQDRPECQEPDKFPLQPGMDAFLRYFQDGNSTPETDTYLNLMKCLWIMSRIKKSAEYNQLHEGSLWQRYVNRMNYRLTKACDRWEQSLAPEPDMDTILRLPDNEFQIWKTEEDEDEQDMVGDESIFLTELLNVTLPSERGTSTHKLRVLQNVDGTIQIQDIATTMTGNRELNDVHRFDAYLDKAHLIPIYACPSSASTVLNVKFKSDKDSANGISPSFGNLNDLLRFQEIITGYKPVLYLGDLEVECHNSTRFSLGGSMSKEKGKVQIWQKKRPAQVLSEEQSSQSSTISPTNPTEPVFRQDEPPERRLSRMSASPPSQGLIEKWRRDSRLSMAPSSITEGSVSSTIFTGTRLSRIDTGSGTIAFRMEKPEVPKLILFLEPKKGGHLSFLSLDMDEDVFINTQTCDCRRPKSRCTVSVIENRKGPLPARRITSKHGLKTWNVAALGTSQPPMPPDPFAVKDLRWIKLQFGSVEDREKFSTRFNDVMKIYKGRLADFYHDMRVVKGRNVATTEFRERHGS